MAMSVACDSTSLLNNAKCIFGCVPPGMAKAIQIALLCNIVNGTVMTDCSAQNLVTQAACFLPCIAAGAADSIIIYLLCQIASGSSGGGGGSGSVLCGTVDPTTGPTGSCGIYYRSDTGGFWYWNGSAWIQFIV
jgi:hypothetical protein